MTDILNELSALAAAIHYPECWDTAAYPDLISALREVTASAGCSVCKSPVELDDPHRLIVLGAPSRRQLQDVLYESAILRAERDKLIQAVADHVTVRAEQHLRIQELEALNETRLGEIRTTLKLLAEARRDSIEAVQELDRCLKAIRYVIGIADRINGNTWNDQTKTAEQYVLGEVQKVEQERDALRNQVRVLSEALTELHDDMADRFDMNDPSTNPGIKEGIKQAAAALAAVREPDNHIEHDLEMVPAPDCWQPIETAPKNVLVLVNNGGVVEIARLFNTGRWFNTRDFECSCVHHWTPLPLPRTSSPAGEGGK